MANDIFKIGPVSIKDNAPEGYGPEDICVTPAANCLDALVGTQPVDLAFAAEELKRMQKSKNRIPLGPLADFVNGLIQFAEPLKQNKVPGSQNHLALDAFNQTAQKNHPDMAASASYQNTMKQLAQKIMDVKYSHASQTIEAQKLTLPSEQDMLLEAAYLTGYYDELLQLKVPNREVEIDRVRTLVKDSIRVKIDWAQKLLEADSAKAKKFLEFAELLQGPYVPRGHQGAFGTIMGPEQDGPMLFIGDFNSEIQVLKDRLSGR